MYIYIYIYIYMYVHFFQTPRAHAIVRSCAALLSCHFEEFQGVRVVRMDDFLVADSLFGFVAAIAQWKKLSRSLCRVLRWGFGVFLDNRTQCTARSR